MALTAAQRAEIRRKFPAFAYLLDEPVLANLFAKAVTEGWGPGEFQAQLMATSWWRSHSETARNWDTIVATDPAEANRQRIARRSEIATEVRRWGVNFNQNEIALIAERSLREGWDSQRISGAIADVARTRGVAAAGDVRSTMQSLKALGKQYAQNVSEATLKKWSLMINAGRMTEDGIRAFYVDLAKKRLDPRGENVTLQRGLDAGLTVRDVYGGVIEAVSTELEIDPSKVDLASGHWGRLLDFADDKGNQRPMTQTEAISWARHQGDWQRTGRARETYSQLANAMSTKWGLKTG